MIVNDDVYRSRNYYAFVLRCDNQERQSILNYLQNLGVRVLYQTSDVAPLRIVRTGTLEHFSEAIRQ